MLEEEAENRSQKTHRPQTVQQSTKFLLPIRAKCASKGSRAKHSFPSPVLTLIDMLSKRFRIAFSRYVSYFSHDCDQRHNKKQLKGGKIKLKTQI